MTWADEPTIELRAVAVEEIEASWRDFWEEIVLGALEPEREVHRGLGVSLTAAQFLEVKANLSDWHHAMTTVSAVYDHATGGRLSKPNYNVVGQITGAIDEHYAEVEADNVIDMLLDIDSVAGQERDDTLQEVVDYVLQCFNISPDQLTDAHKRREQIRHDREKREAREAAEAEQAKNTCHHTTEHGCTGHGDF